MTTIAWDGNALAGDRLWLIGSTRVAGSAKVRRLKAPNGRIALFGFAGDSAYMQAYLHWLDGGERPGSSTGSWQIIIIDDKRCVHYRHDGGQYWDCGGRGRFAIGNGARYALGAMDAGAKARKAVLIASRIDADSGGGVDVVRL